MDKVEQELGRWTPGALALEPPAPAAQIRNLEAAIQRPLPDDYKSLLRLCDGADLRGDRLLSAEEARERWESLRVLIAPTYREDRDWEHPEPPAHLIPIATDLEGNLKCLDLATPGPEVVDWHRETRSLTTWHFSITSWMMTGLRTLSLRFDYRGRPRPIRGRQAETLRQKELQVHLEEDPGGSYPLLELACWHAAGSTPEEALFAFREAATGRPERAMSHYLHGRWAILQGRKGEARRALRRCIAVKADANPRKHSFRSGYLAAAHTLLATLYTGVGQHRKAEEQRRAGDRAAKRYGFDWYAETEEYQEALRALQRGSKR